MFLSSFSEAKNCSKVYFYVGFSKLSSKPFNKQTNYVTYRKRSFKGLMGKCISLKNIIE